MWTCRRWSTNVGGTNSIKNLTLHFQNCSYRTGAQQIEPTVTRARARERRIILTVSMASGSWQRESTAPFLYKLLYKRSHLNKFLLILVCGIGADPNSTIHYSFLNYSPSCTYLYNKYFIYQNWPSTIVSLMACNLFIILSKVNLFCHHLTSDSTYKQ